MPEHTLHLSVENVGGIEQDTVSIDPGVTVLSGENATNRTSLLQSLMAVLGSDTPPIRAGADSGRVTLEYGDETYTREVSSTQSGWKWSGDAVTDNIELLETFGFLLEQNDVRETLASDGDLYDLVMQPVDTDAIEREIDELQERRREIDERGESLSDKKDRVVSLENEIDARESDRDELERELETVQEEIEAIDEDDIQTEKIDENKQLNEKLKSLQDQKQTLVEEIGRAETRLEVRQEELDEKQSTEFDNVEELQNEIQNIKDKRSELEGKVEELESDKRTLSPLKRALSQLTSNDFTTEEFNRVVDKYGDGVGPSRSDTERESITDVLVEDGSERCVICGSEIEPGHYQNLLQDINQINNKITGENEELQEEIESLRNQENRYKNQVNDIRENKNRIEQLHQEIESFQDKIESKRNELDEVETERDEVEAELAALEDEVVEEAEDKTAEIRELESRKTEIEMELKDIESTIENNESEIESLEAEIDEIEAIVEDERPDVEEKIEELRGRVDMIERRVVSEFNDTMEEILDRLRYTNIERIWLQKREQEVKQGRRKVTETVFDLNITREVDGRSTQDSVTNLSESEREVTAITFALTGYLVHDVGDVFPIMLMDSIEMVDASRLEALLEYVADEVEYLIVAALPEDTDAMDVGSVIEKTANAA